jgi:hypothetical protein
MHDSERARGVWRPSLYNIDAGCVHQQGDRGHAETITSAAAAAAAMVMYAVTASCMPGPSLQLSLTCHAWSRMQTLMGPAAPLRCTGVSCPTASWLTSAPRA